MLIHNILSSHKTTFFTSDLMEELRVIFSARVLMQGREKSSNSFLPRKVPKFLWMSLKNSFNFVQI